MYRINRERRAFPARGSREGHAPPLHAFRQRPATREGRMPARRKTHCRGGFHIRPGRSRRRGVPGTMRASSPTGGCYNAEVVVSRLAADLPWFVGEGFIPPAGVCAGAGCGGMRASRPTVVPYVPHQPGTPRVSDARNLCRGGFHCARRRVSEANRTVGPALRP